MSECDCVQYHTAYAAETLEGLRTAHHQHAIVATHCHKCGTSYWSWLDPRHMSGFQDVVDATRTQECGESQLRSIVDEMVARAGMTGIRKDQIRISMKSHGVNAECFVATAVYRSDHAWQVVALRAWRDHCLSHTLPGRLLIAIYEHIGPRLALLVERGWLPRRPLRACLDRIARIVSR